MKISPYKISAGKTAPLIALATLSLLSGCATLLGGNVKGSFACSAPGGTCAPTQVIDDQALGTTVGDIASPATTSLPAQGNGFARTAIGGPPPLRINERVLRIVFPPRIDAAGRYHESYAVHAVVSQSAWADRREPNDKAATLVPQADIGLAALAASAPSLALQEDVAQTDIAARVLPARTPAFSLSAGNGSTLVTSPVEDAKRKVDAFLTGKPQRLGITAINSLAPQASVLQPTAPAEQPKLSSQVAPPAVIKTIIIPAKPTTSVPATSAQSQAQDLAKNAVTTHKSANFPGNLDTGGDE